MNAQVRKALTEAAAEYAQAAVDAKGYTHGSRARALRMAEKRLRMLLWEHRDDIIKEINT